MNHTPDTADNDTIDIRPWPVMELIGRAVVLATLARRGMLEVERERDLFDLETDRFDLSTWARTELQNWLTERDVTLLGKLVGELNEEEIGRCEDALIGASTVAWALRVIEIDQLPLSQDGAAEERTLAWSPEPWAKVRQLQSRVRLRSDEDLARERERWELWYWRAVDVENDDNVLQEVVTEVREAALIPIVDNDFATDAGVPFSGLNDDEQATIAWLAELRLRTLNWVCGFGGSWESAPLYIEE